MIIIIIVELLLCKQLTLTTVTSLSVISALPIMCSGALPF